jgi:putative DNA primase/helicase
MMDGQDDWGDIPKVEDVTAADAQAEVARLARLDAAAYETERKDVANRLGWRTSVLDAEVRKVRPSGSDDDDEGDSPEAIETLEPWADPVEGASLAEEIRDRLQAHVVFGTQADADCAALWVIGSYLMDTWRLWPRLLVTSPTKACGKSTLLEVIDAMAHRGFIVSNASAAAIFRAIEAWRPTLLLDEADTWMKQNEELAGVLNSGHTRRSARVIRVQEVNGEHLPISFSTWCPMVIAGIGSQRDTLMSRSIIISLRRKLPEESVTRLPLDLHAHLLRVRRQAARWAADHAVTLGAMEALPPACGDDRMQDNFMPLWRIAEALGGPWPDRIAAAYAAQALAEDDDAEPAGIMMLRDIAEIFASRSADRIATTDIVGDLMVMEDRPWAEWRHGRPISAQSVAKQMKPFGIKTKVLKLRGSSARVYLRSEVEAAAARYTAQKRNPVTLQQNQQVSGISKCNPEPKVTPEKAGNPLKTNEGYGVTPTGAEDEGNTALDDPYDPEAWA